jgi:hypothetical protein
MALLMSGEQVRPDPRNVLAKRSTCGRRIRSLEDGMLGMGHFEAAANFDCPAAEIHSAMTAARTGPLYGASALHRSMKESFRQLKELQTERRECGKTEMPLLKTQQMKGAL